MIPFGPKIEVGPKGRYKALFDWDSQSPSELSFNAGETIELLDKCEGNLQYEGWWYGRIGTDEGWFPTSYVEEIKVAPVNASNRPVSDVIARLQQQCGFFDDTDRGDSVLKLNNDFAELQATIQASTTKTLEDLGRDTSNKNNTRLAQLGTNEDGEIQVLKKELMELKKKLIIESEEKKNLIMKLEVYTKNVCFLYK
eukprot:TRINITY_DN3236_c0_g1_i1.p1 TRINITY_DN3236_c0_g1~~TRINITY_DN3236_c0_g1_i1.p1  ORF type:complete len:197 (-),score=45.25 TRINITY_DN3236_c0_g1_i1:273-863(-)